MKRNFRINNHIKRIICLSLVVSMFIAFAGCKKNPASADSSLSEEIEYRYIDAPSSEEKTDNEEKTKFQEETSSKIGSSSVTSKSFSLTTDNEIRKNSEETPTREPTIPVYDNAFFSVKDIIGAFNVRSIGKANGTTSYTKIYVPDKKYLYIDPLPNDPYATIKERIIPENTLNETELRNVADDILPRLQTALGETIADYTIEKSTATDSYEIITDTEKHFISISQYNTAYFCFVHAGSTSSNPTQSTYLGGEVITVDQTKSDDEIIASLSSIKQKLFNIFGVSFTETKVIRNYDDDDQYGVRTVTVRFYSKDNSDEIKLHFDNISNYAEDIVSATSLYNVIISYHKYRFSDVDRPIAKARLISVTQAEELLRKGYVFGGYYCPICMAAQESVDFSQYDYVDIEYLSSTYQNKNCSFPFYAFYKYIGNSENGNMTYAKTYVPAIAITDLEEYFKEKHTKHQSTTWVTAESKTNSDDATTH